MFKCQMCGKTSKPKEPMHKKVIETRVRTSDRGIETVREIGICNSCNADLGLRG